jgi:tellurite resistance protein TehA-like permease
MSGTFDRGKKQQTLWEEGIKSLNPAYFALVMATGIVSLASRLWGMPSIAVGLFGLNIGLFFILWALTTLRLIRFPREVWSDLTDHKRGVGFFTTIAANCVLGTQCLLIAEWRTPSIALWSLGILLWCILTYTVFTSFTVKAVKPTLPEGLHGGWLVSVVAAQSIAVLGALLGPGFGSDQERVLFFALTMWLGGGMLYLWIISLIFYRYSFFPMSPADLSPPYWINMGAMAISTLAGATLLAAADNSPLLTQLLPFLKGLVLVCWATATWWIPMLIILGVWRHVYRRFRLTYDPLYWGAVFPLGMYAVCTFRLSQVMDLPFLMPVSQAFLYVALAAWLVTFSGLLYSLLAATGFLKGSH